MTEIPVVGAPLYFTINKDGDAMVLTETRTYIISLPHSYGHESLSTVTLPLNDPYLARHCKSKGVPQFSYFSKADWPYIIGKHVWWLPSYENVDRVLLLTANLNWVIYFRVHGSLQWKKSHEFCPGLKQFVRAHKHLKDSQFIDMSFTGAVSCEIGECDQISEFESSYINNKSISKDILVIDENTMPPKYYLGSESVKTKKKKRIKIEKEKLCEQSDNENDNKENHVGVKKDDSNAVIKQLTQTTTSGVERLVTYILDGKQRNEDVTMERLEEKVQCVCGATEENSSEDEEWVECELCHTWQHVDCVAYYPEVQDYFHCDNCLRNDKNKSKVSKIKSKAKCRDRSPKEKAGMTLDTSIIGTSPCEIISINNSKKAIPDSSVKNKDQTSEQNIATPEDKSSNVSSENHTLNNYQELGEAAESDSSYGIFHRGNHINCPCGASESESGEEWVQCDECDKWQHQICVNYADEDKNHYQCLSCKQIVTFFASKAAHSASAQAQSVSTSQSLDKSSSTNRQFRIPKLSKTNKDDFMEVGSSCCNYLFSSMCLQPVYFPKCVDEAQLVDMLKSSLLIQASDKTSLSNIDVSGSSNWQSTEDSSPEKKKEETQHNGDELTNGIGLSSNYKPHGSYSITDRFSFAFVLYSKCLIILRGSSDGTYQISSVYEFMDKDMCMFSVLSNDVNTEHSIALVDYNSSDVLIWKLKFFNGREISNSVNHMSFPTLILSEERMLPSDDGVCIERIVWRNESQILINKMQTVVCYSVGTLQKCWATDIKLDFIINWCLLFDKKLIIFDSTGSEVIVDTNNGSIVNQSILPQGEDIIFSTKISPSHLLKFQLITSLKPALQYNNTLKLRITSNDWFPNTEQSSIPRTREHLFLKTINGSKSKQQFNESQQQNGHIVEPAEGSVCPICNCDDLTPSASFQVMCSNSHNLFVDPVMRVIVDPFTAKECSWCKVFSLETSSKCGACHKEFES